MKPANVSYHNQKDILAHLNRGAQNKQKPVLNIGDGVRILINKNRFAKGYTPNWSLEIFVIDRIHAHMRQPMYFLKDMEGKELSGGFYASQLQRVRSSYIYRIEKILQERRIGRGKRYLVKFTNYDTPEWIRGSDLFMLPVRK